MVARRSAINGGGCFPLYSRKVKSFYLPLFEGGDDMYVTWELLILFCTFLLAVIKFVRDISNKKR